MPPSRTNRPAAAPDPPAAPIDIVLRDGSTAHVREAEPGDEQALLSLLEGLSADARWTRFFTGGPDLGAAAAQAASASDRGGLSLVVRAGGPELVGHATFEPVGPATAEIAFEVADRLRGQGLATILLARLADAARRRGIERFVAEVLPENRRMLDVFRESGFPMEVAKIADGLHVELSTAVTETTLTRYEERERTAAGAALRHFLAPSSVAIVGASRRRGSVGHELLRSVVEYGFGGAIFVVNRRAREVRGIRTHRSVADLPEAPELVVVATPAEAVVGVAHECALVGARALLVVSAGFAEAGPDGERRQDELLAVCRASGMRLVGPNCLGVIGTPARLNATFAPHSPPPGTVGLLSQSGGVGLALMGHAARLGLGLSSFVSIGNRADMSANDVLEYWEQDPATQVALLYLESFGNPRQFARITRRLAKSKPVVAVHAGRSAAGARAAASHTGAAINASGGALDALLAHAGVIRAETLGELFDIAAVAAAAPIPAGPRVAIVTNAGGPAIMCADACQALGLELPELSQRLRRRLARHLPAYAVTANPVDMLAAAGPSEFGSALETLSSSGEVDAVITIFVPALAATAEEVAGAVAAAAAAASAPVVHVEMAARAARRGEHALPVFDYPESAARALARLVALGRWRADDQGEPPRLAGVRRGEAASLMARATAGGSRWLEPAEVTQLLDCWGLPLIEQRLARGAVTAGRAAGQLGGPVALKAAGEGIVHKTELGAVELGLEGEAQVTRAAHRMAARLRRAGLRVDGFVVQRQLGAGVEMLAGVNADPLVGPLVACGAGGTSVELIGDVAVRLAPLTELEASRMVRSLSTFPLLDGYRGAPPANVAALERVLVHLAALADAHPEVVELDCNPVVVDSRGATVVDARVRVAPPPPRAPWPSLTAEPPHTVPD